MLSSIHSQAYRNLKKILPESSLGISLSFRIYFSAFIVLFTISASYILIYGFQQKQALISKEIINVRVASMESAQKIKESIVAYNQSLFRFVATKSQKDLIDALEFKKSSLQELQNLNTFVGNQVIRSRIIDLKSRMENYFLESGDLIEFAQSNKLPSGANLFQAASWARSQSTQRRELSILSTEGEMRQQAVFALCDEVLTYNRARLSSARLEIDQSMQESKRYGTVIILASVGIVLTVLIGLAITLIGPLRNLLEGVRQIESGEFSREIPVPNTPEMGQLTMAFNRMVRTILHQRDRLIHEAITDGLTGAFNQRHFMQRLEKEFDRAKREEAPLSLMMIDVDHFKSYNDSQGHEMGNVVLRKISMAIKENLRQEDILFRYGGDEFGVILPNADSEESRMIAGRITEVVRFSKFPGETKKDFKKITLSLGGASFPQNALAVNDLTVKADEALYLAKDSGRDCFRWSVAQPRAVIDIAKS